MLVSLISSFWNSKYSWTHQNKTNFFYFISEFNWHCWLFFYWQWGNSLFFLWYNDSLCIPSWMELFIMTRLVLTDRHSHSVLEVLGLNMCTTSFSFFSPYHSFCQNEKCVHSWVKVCFLVLILIYISSFCGKSRNVLCVWNRNICYGDWTSALGIMTRFNVIERH